MDACTAYIAKRASSWAAAARDRPAQLPVHLLWERSTRLSRRPPNGVSVPFSDCPLSERHFSSRDRQICNCMMIHTITAAMMSVPITQLMTIIAHIVANTWSTDDQRRWMRRALDPGASARVAAGYRFFRASRWRRAKRSAWLGNSVLRAPREGAEAAGLAHLSERWCRAVPSAIDAI